MPTYIRKHLSVIAVAFLTATSALAESQYSQTASWLNLLHFNGGARPSLHSGFYLSKAKSPTDELEMIVADLRKQNGKATACRFPARYRWVKKRFDVPEYELEQCRELIDFKKSIRGRKLSIVLSSELMSEPASAFGHVMLRISDGQQSPLASEVIHFAAEVPSGVKGFSYLVTGLTGGFFSFYYREPFFRKAYTYNYVEQRFMEIYYLDASPDQVEVLLDHLFELRDVPFRYYFVTSNCATKLANLLNVAFEAEDSSSISYPIDLVRTFGRHIEDQTVIEPTSHRTKRLLGEMVPAERSSFSEALNDPSHEVESARVREALFNYASFRFRHLGDRESNFGDFANHEFQPASIEQKTARQADFLGPVMAGVGLRLRRDSISNLLIASAGYRDQKNPYRPDRGNLHLLYANTEIENGEGKTTLQRFDLIDMESRPPWSFAFKRPTWLFRTSLNRENTADELRFEQMVGAGLSLEAWPTSLATLIANVGFQANGRGESHGFASPRLGLRLLQSSNFAFGIESSIKSEPGSSSQWSEAYLSTRLARVVLKVAYELREDRDSYLARLEGHF